MKPQIKEKKSWIIRLGNRDLDNIFKKGPVTQGEICTGVSVFEIETDISPNSMAFPNAILEALVDADKHWKQAYVYNKADLEALMKNIPDSWEGQRGIIPAEPPKNNRELWGFLVSDIKAYFRSNSAIRFNLAKEVKY